MAVDVSSQIDLSFIVDGQQADASDVTIPFNDVIGVTNDILNGVQRFDKAETVGTTANVITPALEDTTNGKYYDTYANSSYPAGYTEASAANSSSESAYPGYWFLNAGSASTGFNYYFQTHQSIESLAAGDFFGARFFNLNFERSGTLSTTDFYIGLYANSAGTPDVTRFVRANIQYDSGSSTWRVRGQTYDATTLTSGTWITLDTLPDQLYVRTSIRNDTSATGRIYLGKGLNPFADQLHLSTNMTVTWGAPWLRVHCIKSAVDFVQFRIAGHDFSDES